MSETATQQKITFTKEENLGVIGTLKVTKRLQKIIDYLHYKVGATEWSGILFYKITKGKIDSLKNLEFTADFLYPMNIGSHTYTEFEYNGDIMDAYDHFPEGIEMSSGLIHSHHNMTTFFSGTDSSELKDNAGLYNYYVSLIVNFSHEYCAKIAIPAKTKATYESWFKNTLGNLVPIKTKKEENIVLIGDLKIEIEGESTSDKWLEDRFKVLDAKKKAVVVTSAYSGFNGGFGGRTYDDDFDFPESNFKTKWKENINTSPRSFSSNNASKSKQFLAALINLDIAKSGSDIKKSLTDLKDLKPVELEQYEGALDLNLGIIHDSIYKNDANIEKHCLEALMDLSDHSEEFNSEEFFDIIKQSLGVYAI